MTKDEALKLALEALETAHAQTCSVGRPKDWQQLSEAITAIEQALASPVQEPWKYRRWDDAKEQWELTDDSGWPSEPVYTTPPAAPVQDEFTLRGILASELKCWHRLTEDEETNLLAFVKNMGPKPAPVQEPHPTVYVYRLESGGTQVMAPNINDPALVIDMLEQALVAMSDEGRPITRN